MAGDIENFLKRARDRREELENHGGDYRWEKFIEAREGGEWLPLPQDLLRWVSGRTSTGSHDCALFESNATVFDELTEDKCQQWRRYGFGIRDLAFDAEDTELVSELVEIEDALAYYCILDESHYSELEWEEFQQNIRDFIIGDVASSIDNVHFESDVDEIVEVCDPLREVFWEAITENANRREDVDESKAAATVREYLFGVVEEGEHVGDGPDKFVEAFAHVVIERDEYGELHVYRR